MDKKEIDYTGKFIVEKYKELQKLVKKHVESNPTTKDDKIKCALEVHFFLNEIFMAGRKYQIKQFLNGVYSNENDLQISPLFN